MTYHVAGSTEHKAIPEALALLTLSSQGAPTTDSVLNLSSINNVQGTSGIVISAGSMTLPGGYWYYLEGSSQAISGTFDTNDQLQYRWYNNNTATYFGARGRVAFNWTSSDQLLSSYDERAVALIYAATDTAVSLRCVLNSGITGTNNISEPQYIYAALGRALVIKLDGPAP